MPGPDQLHAPDATSGHPDRPLLDLGPQTGRGMSAFTDRERVNVVVCKVDGVSVGIAVDLVSGTGSGASPLCPNGPGARAAASAAKHKRRPRITARATNLGCQIRFDG